MGIYSGQELYVTKNELRLSTFRDKEGVFSIGFDAEHIIGTGIEKKLSGNDLVNYVKDKYDPFLKNGYCVFMVFSGKPIKYREDVICRRPNDKLKWQKSVLKSYSNQDKELIKKDVYEFIWNKTVSFFNKFPPSPNKSVLFKLYQCIFVKNKPELILNKENYVYFMKKIGYYVWSQDDDMLELFEKFFVQKEEVIFQNLHISLIWELSYNHWCNKMGQKRLIEHISYVKKSLNGIVPIVESTYDGDDQLVMMIKLGIIHAIFSGDSDFLAFNSNIVIVGINEEEDSVQFIKLSEMYYHFEKKGYSRTMVRNAMLISTADYNPEFYKFRIPFRDSLKACKTIEGNTRDYYTLFKYFCNKYNIIYNKNKADEISHAYTLSTCNDDVFDSINIVLKSLVNYTFQNNTQPNYTSSNVKTRLYLYFIKILLLYYIQNNNKNLKTKEINNTLNMFKKQTYSSIGEFTRML